MNVVKCPYCGTEHSEGTCFDACPHCHAPHQPSWAKFCNSCGAELTPTAPLPVDYVIATKRCPQCHTAGLPESAAFCSVCGYDFNARKESPRIVITCVRKEIVKSYNSRPTPPHINYGKGCDFELREGVNILRLSQYYWLTANTLSFCSGDVLAISKIDFVNACLRNQMSFHVEVTSLDVHNIDTLDWNMLIGCFSHCSKLENLDLSSFKTCNIKWLDWCFCDCYKLKMLDISGWSLSNIKDYHCMFLHCKSLRTIIMRGCNDYTVDLVETALEEAGLNNVEIIR